MHILVGKLFLKTMQGYIICINLIPAQKVIVSQRWPINLVTGFSCNKLHRRHKKYIKHQAWEFTEILIPLMFSFNHMIHFRTLWNLIWYIWSKMKFFLAFCFSITSCKFFSHGIYLFLLDLDQNFDKIYFGTLLWGKLLWNHKCIVYVTYHSFCWNLVSWNLILETSNLIFVSETLVLWLLFSFMIYMLGRTVMLVGGM